MSEWRAIETAPKDGTVIDLWINEEGEQERVTDCYWCEFEEMWITDTEGSIIEHPTHWMPLPPPPRRSAMSEMLDRVAAAIDEMICEYQPLHDARSVARAAIEAMQPSLQPHSIAGEIYLHLTAEQMHGVIGGFAWIELTAEQRAVLKPSNAQANPAQSLNRAAEE